LSIGKKGQNVRLASKLIGWDIDIKSEEEKRQEIEAEMTALTAPATPLTSLAGVGAKTIEKMEAAGITSVEKLASMTPEQLMEIPGIGEKMVDKIYQSVNRFYESGTEGAATGEGAAGTEAVEGEPAAEAGEASAEGAVEEPSAEASEAAGTTEAPEQNVGVVKEAAAPEETQTETASAETEGEAGQREEAKSE